MSATSDGVWLSYYPDWSDFHVWKSEIAALRYGMEHNMLVIFLRYGEDLPK